MKKFGQIKNKFFSKMLDSYTTNNKDVTKLMNIIKEDKIFKDLYLLYEKTETQYFSDKETAIHYVNELSQSLKGKNKIVDKTLKKLDESIGEVKTQFSQIYDCLDTLLEEDNLLNIESKVVAKLNLVNHLTTKKEITESNSFNNFSKNETLLYSVLSNNFNVLYENIMSDEDKKEFREIVSLSENKLENKVTELKENILKKIDTLLSESSEVEFVTKLENVKKEVENTSVTKYNLFKLKELRNGLD